jgi:hypothetical protein
LPSNTFGLTLQGDGYKSTFIKVNHTGHGFSFDTSCQEITFRQFKIYTANPTTNTGNGIYITAYDGGTYGGFFVAQQLWIESFRAGAAFNATQMIYSFFNDIYFRDCKYGFHLINLNYIGKVQNAVLECSEVGFLTDGTSDFRSWSFDTINTQGFHRESDNTNIQLQYGFYFNQTTADISITNVWYESVTVAGVQTDASKNHSNYILTQHRFSDNLCDIGFLLNNMTTAVLSSNNFSNITAEVYLYGCANVIDANNIHINANQTKWFVDNGPVGDYNIFQPSQSTTTRSGDAVLYVPTSVYPAGFKLLTAGGNVPISAYAQFGDGTGHVLQWRNNAATPTNLYAMYDTGDFQLNIAGKGIILTNPAGTLTQRVTLAPGGGSLVFTTI